MKIKFLAFIINLYKGLQSMCFQEDINGTNFKYKKMESNALLMTNSSVDTYLCIRADGVKSSKRHLKDVITNKIFNDSFNNAINSVYHLNKYQTYRVNYNFFFCAFSASDEVSFIINKGNNYYENRILKICTILSSILSSAMTIDFELMTRKQENREIDKKKRYPDIMAFDARPIILNDILDVKEYIHYRWLIACRNAACKVLRLKSELSQKEIYDDELNNNLDLLLKKVNDLGFIEDYKEAVDSFCLYIPDYKGDLSKFKINKYNFSNAISRLDEFVHNSQSKKSL